MAMRKIYIIIMIALLAAAAASCQKEDIDICGEWHYSSAENNEDIYIGFSSDGSFELYQKFEAGMYHLYRGKWTLNGNKLSGKYNDGATWHSSYKISVSGTSLTMTNSGTRHIYSRASIPDSVKETCIVEVKSLPLMLNSHPQYCWL